MSLERCYWQSLAHSESPEAISFREEFMVDYERCRRICKGLGGCQYYVSTKAIQEGTNLKQHYKEVNDNDMENNNR